ncbi:MAG: hypothetical protein AB1782_15500 [Cyanobacteriota bacterium]
MKIILFIISVVLLCFLNSCSCSFCNVKQMDSLSVQEKERANLLAEKVLALLKDKNYTELLKNNNLLSTKLEKKEFFKKQMDKIIPCLDETIGDLEYYNPEERTFQKELKVSINRKSNYILVMQPVEYTNDNLTIVLTLVEEEGEMKLFGINWNARTTNINDLDFLKCFKLF